MNTINQLIIYTDGGARGNPGEGAAGVVIKNNDGKIIEKFGKFLGNVTNNEAEYYGVIYALQYLTHQSKIPDKLLFKLDSLLVVMQLQGVYKIKKNRLVQLHQQIKSLEKQLSVNIDYKHIPRKQNFEADLLVNQTLDHFIGI